MTRRIPRHFPALLALLLVALCASARARAAEWVSVRTRNFTVLSQAGEEEARRAAHRLEQYRAAFARLLPPEHFDESAQTSVFIFRDAAAYAPFKPVVRGLTLDRVSGYFQPGPEVNYITLSAEAERRGDSSTLLHEYAHLLVNNYFAHAPLWLKEGMAEFYGAARLSGDGRRLALGAPLRHRAQTLRRQRLLPLRALFAVDQQSPFYSEPYKRALFYAQSWALVHYLLDGGRDGRERLTRYLARLADGANAEEAFKEVFGAGAADADFALAAYVRRGEYRERSEPLGDATPAPTASVEARPLTEAESLAHLGGLLLGAERAEEAEAYLLRANELEPGLAASQAALGAQRLRQGRFAEAVKHLRAAADAGPENYLTRFRLADALHRDGLGMGAEDTSISGFEEKTRLVLAELRRAVELAPNFIEAYRLLAVVELEREGRVEAAAATAERALRLAPRRRDLQLLLAQIRLSAGDLDNARATALPLSRAADPALRAQAATLLEQLAAREEEARRLRARPEEEARLAAQPRAPTQPCDMPDPGPQQKPIRFGGAQACGRLVRIECGDDEGVLLHVEAGPRLLRLRAEAFNRIRFVTYTTAVKTGRIACGPRDPADLVLVTYLPAPPGAPGPDGQAAAVEFLPPDWNR